MKQRMIVFLLAISLFLLVEIPPLKAAWAPGGNLICDAAEYQFGPKIVSDGAGGMILAWLDERHFRLDVYAQRSDGSGNTMWADGGIALSDTRGYYDNLIDLVTDGAGGAIAVWWDQTNGDLIATRIGPDGTKLWGETGKVVGTLDTPINVVVAPDGSGGALIAWVIDVGDYEPYIQKLDSDGNELWTSNGLLYSTRMLHDSKPDIEDDGAGGALIAFVEADLSARSILAQRVFANGALWDAAGVFASSWSSGPPSPSYFPSITRDGAGGAWVAWQEGDPGSRVYVRNIDAGGNLRWTDPHIVSLAAGGHEKPEIISDGLGGACIVWRNHRNPSFDIYAQRMDEFGTRLWALDGVPICEAADDQLNAIILTRSSQDFTIAWMDERGGATGPVKSLYTQKVDFGGAVQWAADGTHVITGIADLDYGFAADGSGGMMAAIGDDRSLGTGADIYAQSINSFGSAASPEPAISGISDVPGDQGGNVRITIARSDRDHLGQAFEAVTSYDIWQRVDDPSASFKVLTLSSDKEQIPSAGPMTMIESESRRFVVSAEKGAFPQGVWEFVGGFGASQTDEYIFRASTLADSSAAGISYSVFAVAARTTNSSAWFISAPDSGYSVDNIVPGVPKNIVADYLSTGVALAWDDAEDDDFQFYRIYRSTAPGFLPSPANLVHELPVSAWTDPATNPWEYHYKITVLDHAGNESEAGSPESVSGVQGDAVPARTALLGAVPNPFNPSTKLSFELAAADHARLKVYDTAGRLIATLVDEHHEAGNHDVVWDGMDDAGRMSSAGVYLYRLEVGDFIETKRMTLLK